MVYIIYIYITIFQCPSKSSKTSKRFVGLLVRLLMIDSSNCVVEMIEEQTTVFPWFSMQILVVYLKILE